METEYSLEVMVPCSIDGTENMVYTLVDGDKGSVPKWASIDSQGVLKISSPLVQENTTFFFNIETTMDSEALTYTQEIELLVIYPSTCNFLIFISV